MYYFTKNMKKINKFFIYLIFFSVSIFFLKDYFFWVTNDEYISNIENKYIEPSLTKNEYIIDKNSFKENDNQNIKVDLQSAYNISFLYFPKNIKNSVLEYSNTFKTILNSKSFISKIDRLKVELHWEKNDVRWKMKNHSVKLYWIKKMKLTEFSSVGIHEFWHYVDLYFLEKKVFTDLSEYFYNISWNSTKVLKAWQVQENFVSWYAMTNKYEDFAESFTYYILHNDDFLYKTKKSIVLKNKYNFFKKYVFRDFDFEWTDFSKNNKIKEYYRDITKIDFSLENFLEFLKK